MKLALLVLALALALAGCGVSNLPQLRLMHRQLFAAQHLKPVGAKVAVAPPGLDSQEASRIAASYHKSLVPSEVKVQEEPILLLAPSDKVRGQPTR